MQISWTVAKRKEGAISEMSERQLKSPEQHEEELDLLALHLAAGSDLITALADSDCLNEFERDATPKADNVIGGFCLGFIMLLGFALAWLVALVF